MKARTHVDAARFLENTRTALKSNEAANSLMLGICGQLVHHPEQIRAAACLKTVEDEKGLVLAAVMTPPRKLVVYGHRGDLDGGTRLLVRDLAAEGWGVPGVLGPSEMARRVAERWAEATGRGVTLEGRQRVYELREVIRPVPERGRLRRAEDTDVELVTRWQVGFQTEIFGPANREEMRREAVQRVGRGDIYLWEDRGPVSMAMKTRPTRHGIGVGLVYTPPELRGRGYATACVGELSRALLESGWGYCALFADQENRAANRVYRTVGYRPICDYAEYAFLEEAADAST